MENGNMLVQFVSRRNSNNGDKVGVLVAIGANQVGWSLCKDEDRVKEYEVAIPEKYAATKSPKTKKRPYFNKEEAVRLAFNRACEKPSIDEVPLSLKKKYVKMLERAKRYYK